MYPWKRAVIFNTGKYVALVFYNTKYFIYSNPTLRNDLKQKPSGGILYIL